MIDCMATVKYSFSFIQILERNSGKLGLSPGAALLISILEIPEAGRSFELIRQSTSDDEILSSFLVTATRL
jgi:hypothetical protein